MSRAGTWLHRAAGRICSRTTMERLIEPLVADMRHEHVQALARGRWQEWRVRTAGYLAFWTAVLIHMAAVAPRLGLNVAAADGWLVARIAAIAVGVFLGVTFLMTLPPLEALPPVRPASRGWLLLTLVPQAMVIGAPIALSSAIAYGCRGRRPSPRIVATVLVFAVIGTALALTTRQWLIPAGNQAFRVTMAGEDVVVRGLRGPSELSLSELGARIDALRAGSADAPGAAAEAARLARIYHLHWAPCFASLALGLFSLGVWTFSSRRLPAVAAGIAAPVAYWACLWVLDASATRAMLHPVTYWLPNATFVSGGMLLVRLRSRGQGSTLPPRQPCAP